MPTTVLEAYFDPTRSLLMRNLSTRLICMTAALISILVLSSEASGKRTDWNDPGWNSASA